MAALLIITLLVASGGYTSAYGDQPGDVASEITSIIISCGFENVRASILSDTLIVEYENRIYFREKDAVRIILGKITGAARNIQTLILVSKKDDVPLLWITASRDDYLISKGSRDIFDKLERSQKATTTDYDLTGRKYNSSIGKVDIVIHPEADFLLGRYEDPLIYWFAISPEFSTFLGKGIRSNVQVSFLLHDELKHKKQRVTLSRLCLDYMYRSSASSFMNLGGGYFGSNRYGLASEVLRFGWDNRLGFGGAAAWLGNMYYRENTLYCTKMWNWLALASLQYKLPLWNTLFTIRFGKFLYQDRGISAEITRFLHSICITIFAAKTSSGSIGGFEIKFLTYPHRHPVPHRVRVRLPTILKMNYRYKESDVGVIFSPGYNADYATDSFWLMDFE